MVASACTRTQPAALISIAVVAYYCGSAAVAAAVMQFGMSLLARSSVVLQKCVLWAMCWALSRDSQHLCMLGLEPGTSWFMCRAGTRVRPCTEVICNDRLSHIVH